MVFAKIKDKKVMIYKNVTKKNKLDEVVEVWEPISSAKLWAAYRSLSGDLSLAAAQHGYKADAVFTVNWRRDLVPGMIVVYNKKIWTISRVDDLEGYKGDIKLTCELSSQAQSAFPGVVL